MRRPSTQAIWSARWKPTIRLCILAVVVVVALRHRAFTRLDCLTFAVKLFAFLLSFAEYSFLTQSILMAELLRCLFGCLLCWTVFAWNRDTAVPAGGNDDLQTLICVLVARPRRCPTLSNPGLWQNWMVAYLGYSLRMKTLFRGWPIIVNNTHTRRRFDAWPECSTTGCPNKKMTPTVFHCYCQNHWEFWRQHFYSNIVVTSTHSIQFHSWMFSLQSLVTS